MMERILAIFFIVFLIGCGQQNESERDSVFNSVVLQGPEIFIRELPKVLAENSALLCSDNLIWTCNDSGGKNKIYGFTPDGNIVKKVTVENAQNHDWEAMAQDENFIYIGDFGNNNGVRKDLKIYKIGKKDIEKAEPVVATEINFSFANQKQFRFSPHAHRFDCEAMAELNDELFLFTKDWETETTTVYKVPKTEGTYELQPFDSLQVNGLITGADFSPDKTKLALVGYHNFKPLLRVFHGVSEKKVFGNEYYFANLDSIERAQTEGVCFLGNDSLLVSCEKTSRYPAQVFLVNLTSIKHHGTY